MIQLDYRDARPIYEQIRDGIRKLIETGVIRPGERLPSVRELASELAINPNTIQRAYRELEREGYLNTIAGKGAFAAEWSDAGEARKQELLRQLYKLVAELEMLGMSRAEIAGAVKEGPL